MSDCTFLLHSPVAISGKWQFDWFDPAHHHSVLYQDGYFYIINYLDDNPVPILFCIQNDLPAKILFAKISLSKEFIAIQLNFTNVLILDIVTRKKYLLEIKSTYDGSCILPQGIIWSDHGGGTQDLVIVTNKALEFYKISSKKLYCKSTRNINHNAFGFWYNHDHRMILTSSYRQNNTFLSRIQKVNSGISATSQKEILIMEGYFLKAERSAMPLLELPPPDRMPRFELGPGVSGESITLISVYGKLLVLVQYTQEEADFFTVYHLQKSTHEKIATLALGSIIKQIQLSTYDNLIVCHDLERSHSLLFDIMATPREKTSVTATPIIDPISGPSPPAYAQHIEIEDPDSTIPGKRSNFADTFIIPSVPLRPTSYQSARIYDLSGLSFALNPEIPLNGSIGIEVNAKRDSIDEISSKMKVSVNNLTQPREISSFYDPQIFEIESSDYVFHRTERIMWKIKVCLAEVLDQFSNPREKLLFLSRRGRFYFQANRQQYDNSPINHAIFGNQLESKEAKQRLLITMLECLTLVQGKHNRTKIGSLDSMEVVHTLTDTYLREYHRLRSIESVSANSSSSTNNINGNNSLFNSDIDLKSIDLELCEFYLQRYTSTSGANSLFASYRINLEPSYHRYLFSAIEQTRLLAMTTNSIQRSQSPLPPNSSGTSLSSNSSQPPTNLRMFKSRSISLTAAPNASISIANSSTVGLSDVVDLEVILNNDPLEPASGQAGSGMSSISHHPYLPDINLIGMKVKAWMSQKKSNGIQGNKDEFEQEDSQKLSSLSILNIANNIPNMDYVPISLRRDEKGDLVVNQTELLSYVWIPLLLSPGCDFVRSCEMLTNYMVALVERGIEVIPAFSMLHLHLLYFLKQYQEIRNFLSMSLYADNTEVAFMILQFAGMMQEEFRLKQLSKPFVAMKTLQSCISCFQTHGVDMLWRMKQYSAAVKWYLTHGFVLEAIDLCKKRVGYSLGKVDNSSISGIEFFISAVNYLKVGAHRSMSLEQVLFHVHTFLLSWDPKLIIITQVSSCNFISTFI